MFSIGDKVVYPVHGAGIVEAIEEKEVLGELKQYYVLKLFDGEMRVMVPVDAVQGVGLRSVSDDAILQRVSEVLRCVEEEETIAWNKRYQQHMTKIKSGDVFLVAEVVRSLTLRDMQKGLAAGERKMLDQARKILVSEFMVAKDIDEQQAKDMINECFPKEN
ncbi:MAG: CarD family transcriptional regulator [Peptococcaceae bacterium]|jgi:CarD family transcriptional regulator|nr:CarD family transcriptional regulator [Peptococcaceae bacterium]